jgi:prenylcysteine oxidase/farnesylcysteine lyase
MDTSTTTGATTDTTTGAIADATANATADTITDTTAGATAGAKQKRVAIVGAGAAGSVAAYRLWQKLGDSVHITVYERCEHVGGRAWDLMFAGTRIEVGGTLLHSSGKYTMELMKLTDSKEGTSGLSIDGKDETYAFWTDKGFSVLTHSSLSSMAVGILKYVGIGTARKVVSGATGMASKWERVYELLEKGQTFTTPQEMLKALDLYEPTQVSLADYLEKLGSNKRMTYHIVESIIHNMYNQGAEIGALAGLVGLAGAGLAGGYLFAIEEGNWTVYDKTLKKIGADLRVNTQVSHIKKQNAENGPSFTVTTTDGSTESYDAVVLAAPFALADLEVTLDDAPLDAAVHPYQEVQTTLVVGTLNPAFFGADPNKKLPSTVFTSDSAGAPFKSIGVTGYSPTYESRIYKIFSAAHEMTEEELGRIFTTIHDVHRFVWRGAYPVISPGIDHLPFELAPGLFYACAFETAAGAIEVESVGAWNTAELAATYLS